MATLVDWQSRSFEARRRYVRVAQIGRAITIVVNGEERPFTLTNISARGAAGSCAAPLETGQFYTFVFESGASYRGEIRWLRDALFGVFFANALPTAVLTPPARGRERLPRAPRYSVSRPGTLTIRGAPRPCLVRNISISGMMLETTMPPQAGQHVHFAYGAFHVEGEVRWVSRNTAGIRFLTPIDLDEFEERGVHPPDRAHAATEPAPDQPESR